MAVCVAINEALEKEESSMKTRTARWYQNSPSSWILKEPVKHGGAVLAVIGDRESGEYYRWQLGSNVDVDPVHVTLTRYEAHRAVRRALREETKA